MNAMDVARILGIREPRGRFESDIDLVSAQGAVEFGTVVYTYDMIGGLVNLVTVELVTEWGRRRLRGQELPVAFVRQMLARASHEQELEAMVAG